MKNENIQALRGLLMLWIVLFHYTFRVSELYSHVSFPIRFENGGNVGVYCFFVISGYFLFQGIIKPEQLSIKETIQFIANKYWRLWIPYLIAILLIFSLTNIWDLPGRIISFKTFLLNACFIWHPNIAFVDSAHWYIYSLVIIQIILSLFLLIPKSLRIVSLLYFEIFLIAIYGIDVFLHNPFAHKLTWFLCIESMLKVYVGFNFLNISVVKKNIAVNLLLLVLIMLYMMATVNFLWIAFFSGLVFFSFQHNKQLPFIKVFSFIGNYSFEWYLIHQNVGYLLILWLYGTSFSSEILIVIPCLLTFIFGIIIHRLACFFPKRVFE